MGNVLDLILGTIYLSIKCADSRDGGVKLSERESGDLGLVVEDASFDGGDNCCHSSDSTWRKVLSSTELVGWEEGFRSNVKYQMLSQRIRRSGFEKRNTER